jgi:hypothetical protein
MGTGERTWHQSWICTISRLTRGEKCGIFLHHLLADRQIATHVGTAERRNAACTTPIED